MMSVPCPYTRSDEALKYSKFLSEEYLRIKSSGMEKNEIQEAKDKSYDYAVKLWSKKCEGCQHWHAVTWESFAEKLGLCWKCMEEKYDRSPIWAPTDAIDGCVCCRTLTWKIN